MHGHSVACTTAKHEQAFVTHCEVKVKCRVIRRRDGDPISWLCDAVNQVADGSAAARGDDDIGWMQRQALQASYGMKHHQARKALPAG